MSSPNPSESYVFFSHNSQDNEVVKRIADKLESRGVAVWLDTEGVAGGDHFEQKITQAMRRAKANVILYGTYGLGRYQKKEVLFASKLDIEGEVPAIVVLLPNVAEEKFGSDEEIGFTLHTKSFIKFGSATDESAINSLLRSLTQGISSEKRQAGSRQQQASPDTLRGNYAYLEALLKAGKWEEADLETAKQMYQVMGRQEEGWLRKEDIEQFPCADLRAIDQLWVKHSHGKFGFSVQKLIYLRCGGNPDGTYSDDKIKNNFLDQVGWRVKGSWICDNDLTFHISAPSGHLPFFWRLHLM